MNSAIKITKGEYKSFTTFRFYTNLLNDIRDFYHSPNYDGQAPILSFEDPCFIDSSALPLILTLGNTLKKFHNNLPVVLKLHNIPGTFSNDMVWFLDKSDFFYLVGDNSNPTFPLGRNIFKFEKNMLGGYGKHNNFRIEHKIRGFSKSDIKFNIKGLSENEQRDKLIEHFSFIVAREFEEVFDDNELTSENKNEFTEYLSELITNSLLHSDADCFVTLHTNRYRTAISISDSGIGLYESISKKVETLYYKRMSLFNSIKIPHDNLSENIQKYTYSIFETLYFSCLKDRKGLFDLVCSIVLDGHGVVRIHNFSVQLIISSKVENELLKLNEIRKKIYKIHLQLRDNNNDEINKENELLNLSNNAKEIFSNLFKKIFKGYTNDIRFSSVRFFDSEFRGVHIEAEIPRTY